MKKCPTCQKTFDDDKRFCQVDGTPLVAAEEQKAEPNDPYKTVVGQPFNPPSGVPSDDMMKTMVVDSSSKNDDILQMPEVFDPMKTVVSSDPFKKDNPPAKESVKQPEPPKFNEPSLNPPSFGNLSSPEKPKSFDPPKFESPFSAPPKEESKQDAPKFGSPFSSDPPKFGSPFDEKKETQAASSDKPKDNPFPPFKESAPLGEKLDPFQNSAFGLPHIPLDQSYTPPKPDINPTPVQQNDWSAPPVNSWQDDHAGSNSPYQSPANASYQSPAPVAGMEGQNKTLAIVSLATGIAAFLCLGPIGAIAAVVTGYMQRNNIKKNPSEYGGGGMALVGMVLGAINLALTVIFVAIWLLLVVASVGQQ